MKKYEKINLRDGNKEIEGKITTITDAVELGKEGILLI